ncbi:MAG: hypothetical protein AAGA54_22170 [Myxococcota bacterium]
MRSRSVLVCALSAGLICVAAPSSADAAALPGIDADSGFIVYYGDDFGAETFATLASADVVVLHPEVATVTPQLVAQLKAAGVQYVLAYLSIGEEPSSMPIEVGDGTGPVHHDGTALQPGNAGVASFYVDDAFDGQAYVQDGAPDTNAQWGGRYIFPNAQWRDILQRQRIGGSADYPARSAPGVEQLLGARLADDDIDRTHDFGFDGLFLDTIGTAAPYVNVPGAYPWAAEAMSQTVAWLDETWPAATLMANRGLFYFNPNVYNPVFDVHPHDFTIRPYIDALAFEWFRLCADEGVVSPFYADNRHNYAPKIAAEAMREDGFSVFSLDYAGYASTQEREASVVAAGALGWTPYLAADSLLWTVSDYMFENPLALDVDPPQWDSTASGYTQVDVADRVGVQRVELGQAQGEVILSWDVATDQTGPVTFDVSVATDPAMSDAVVHHAVTTQAGDGWDVDTSNAFAFETVLAELDPGAYYFAVHAVDGLGHRDDNDVVLSITVPDPMTTQNDSAGIVVDGSLVDWSGLETFSADGADLPANDAGYDLQSLRMADGGGQLVLGLEFAGTAEVDTWRTALYFDTDLDRDTGFIGSGALGAGAEFMLQGEHVFAYEGDGESWDWAWLGRVDAAANGSVVEMAMPKSWLDDPAVLEVVYRGYGSVQDFAPDEGGDGANGGGYGYVMNE